MNVDRESEQNSQFHLMALHEYLMNHFFKSARLKCVIKDMKVGQNDQILKNITTITAFLHWENV